MKKNKNVLVIGGSGFLGSNILEILYERKYNVTNYDINPPKIINKNIKFIKGNIENKVKLFAAMKNQDIVYHLASIADIEENIKNPFKALNINIIGTLNIIESIIKNKVKKLLYASSLYVYSNKGSFYRIAKQTCENIIEEFAKKNQYEFINLRYGSLYGKRSQEWNGLNQYIRQILKNKKIIYFGDGNERREYIHVIDAAKMTVDLLNKNYKNCPITITGNQTFTSKDILHLIFEIMGYKKNIVFKDNTKEDNAHYSITPYRYTPSISKKLISNETLDIGEGILEIIDEINNIKK